MFRLETERTVMREWQEADRDPFLAMCQDEEGMRYLPKLDRAGADALIDRQIAMQAAHRHCFWALERKSDGEFLGIVGIGAPRDPLTEIEIGWRLARPAWKQGYALEAARAALDWAFATQPVDSVISITVLANEPSWRVMERLGMIRQPHEDFLHPALAEDDPLRPHILYRINRPI